MEENALRTYLHSKGVTQDMIRQEVTSLLKSETTSTTKKPRLQENSLLTSAVRAWLDDNSYDETLVPGPTLFLQSLVLYIMVEFNKDYDQLEKFTEAENLLRSNYRFEPCCMLRTLSSENLANISKRLLRLDKKLIIYIVIYEPQLILPQIKSCSNLLKLMLTTLLEAICGEFIRLNDHHKYLLIAIWKLIDVEDMSNLVSLDVFSDLTNNLISMTTAEESEDIYFKTMKFIEQSSSPPVTCFNIIDSLLRHAHITHLNIDRLVMLLHLDKPQVLIRPHSLAPTIISIVSSLHKRGHVEYMESAVHLYIYNAVYMTVHERRRALVMLSEHSSPLFERVLYGTLFTDAPALFTTAQTICETLAKQKTCSTNFNEAIEARRGVQYELLKFSNSVISQSLPPQAALEAYNAESSLHNYQKLIYSYWTLLKEAEDLEYRSNIIDALYTLCRDTILSPALDENKLFAQAILTSLIVEFFETNLICDFICLSIELSETTQDVVAIKNLVTVLRSDTFKPTGSRAVMLPFLAVLGVELNGIYKALMANFVLQTQITGSNELASTIVNFLWTAHSCDTNIFKFLNFETKLCPEFMAAKSVQLLSYSRQHLWTLLELSLNDHKKFSLQCKLIPALETHLASPSKELIPELVEESLQLLAATQLDKEGQKYGTLGNSAYKKLVRVHVETTLKPCLNAALAVAKDLSHDSLITTCNRLIGFMLGDV